MAEYDDDYDEYYSDDDCDSYTEPTYGTIGPSNTEPYNIPMSPRLAAYIQDLKARFGHASDAPHDSDDETNTAPPIPESHNDTKNDSPSTTTLTYQSKQTLPDLDDKISTATNQSSSPAQDPPNREQTSTYRPYRTYVPSYVAPNNTSTFI